MRLMSLCIQNPSCQKPSCGGKCNQIMQLNMVKKYFNKNMLKIICYVKFNVGKFWRWGMILPCGIKIFFKNTHFCFAKNFGCGIIIPIIIIQKNNKLIT